MRISVTEPSVSVTVRIISVPVFTNAIELPSRSKTPPDPPVSELNKDSARSLDS